MATISHGKDGKVYLRLDSEDLTPQEQTALDNYLEHAKIASAKRQVLEDLIRDRRENKGRDISVFVKWGQVTITQAEGRKASPKATGTTLADFWAEQDRSGRGR